MRVRGVREVLFRRAVPLAVGVAVVVVASVAAIAALRAGDPGTTDRTPPGVPAAGPGEPETARLAAAPGSGSARASASVTATAATAGPQACPPYPAFPDAGCTGVPAGVVLAAYAGPCTVTANGTVIDARLVRCSPLSIRASDVVIRNSRVHGSVGTPDGASTYSFTISDSEVITPQATGADATSTGLGEANFTAVRVDVSGGNRSVYCRKRCTVRDSWVHGQSIAATPRIHASGIRQSQGATLIHNRIHCEAADTPSGGGCSADLTGYGDFEPVRDNRIEKNLFVATPGGACAYGGSSGDDGSKPYGNQAANIVFVDNVFERGRQGRCGFYFPVTDFDSTRPGNQWRNNRWTDGTPVPPAN